MAKKQALTEETPILVEFSPATEVAVRKSLAPLSVADLAQKSSEALERAMGTIRQMSLRVADLRHTLPDEFTTVELGFGIKLDAEAGAVISKVGGEAAIHVTLTWERPRTSAEAK
jgi:hypothetical protein